MRGTTIPSKSGFFGIWDNNDLDAIQKHKKTGGTRITRVGKRPSTPERHGKDHQWDWYFKMREEAKK